LITRPYRPPVEVEENAASGGTGGKGSSFKGASKARYEKRHADKREFTARKKVELLTPEDQEAEEKRLAHNREWQKEWREKRKATEPPKPPKKKSIKELMELEKTGAELTPEETERLAEYRRKKAAQHKAWRERQNPDSQRQGRSKSLPPPKKEGEALNARRNRNVWKAHKSPEKR